MEVFARGLELPLTSWGPHACSPPAHAALTLLITNGCRRKASDKSIRLLLSID